MAMTTPNMREPRVLTGRRVLLYIVSFFAVVFAANGVFLYFALGSFPGVVVESSYKAGQSYNEDIAAAKAQEARAWDVSTHIERSGDGMTDFSVKALDKTGRPISGLAFSAQLQRPTMDAADKTVALVEGPAGEYRVAVPALDAGNWILTLEAVSDAERVFRSQNRVILAE